MTHINPVENLQKLSRIWTRQQQKEITVRIHYGKQERDGCKIYRILQVDRLD